MLHEIDECEYPFRDLMNAMHLVIWAALEHQHSNAEDGQKEYAEDGCDATYHRTFLGVVCDAGVAT